MFPSNVCPITLRRHKKPFSHPDWLFELKHDRFRSYVRLGPSAVAAANKAKELKTRNMRRITAS